MCFDICTINIRVSIRVRGLHLVFTLGTKEIVFLESPMVWFVAHRDEDLEKSHLLGVEELSILLEQCLAEALPKVGWKCVWNPSTCFHNCSDSMTFPVVPMMLPIIDPVPASLYHLPIMCS